MDTKVKKVRQGIAKFAEKFMLQTNFETDPVPVNGFIDIADKMVFIYYSNLYSTIFRS